MSGPDGAPRAAPEPPVGTGREQIRAGVRLLGAGNRRRWAAVALLSLVASMFEIVGGVLVVGLLGSATTGNAVIPVVGDLSQRFPDVERGTLLATAAALTAAFFLVRGVYLVVDVYVRSRIAQNAGAVLATRILEGYLAMPYTHHISRNSAELIRNTTDSVSTVLAYVIVPGVVIFSELSIVVALLALLLVRAPWPTLAALAVFAPVVAVLLRVVQPRLGALGREAQIELRSSLKGVQQALHGFRDIALLDRRDVFRDHFARPRFSFARIKYVHATLTDVPRIAIETASTVFVLGYLGIAALQGTTARDSFEVLGLFAYAAFRIMPSLNRIVASVSNLRFGGAAALDLAADLDDAERYMKAGSTTAVRAMPFATSIRLEGVSFTYPGSVAAAVSGIDVEVLRGSSVAFVGPTGGGKSTIIDLLTGLIQPTSGVVRVDGADIAGRAAEWQANLGVVSQSVYLLDDTLRANIAFGVAPEDVDEDAVAEAVRLAQLEDVLQSSPDGLDTMLGERGVRLSGGQRQRVAIARALYRRPSVIVFDEGTSALDRATEVDVVDAVARLRGQHTIVMVAHRIATVRDCDVIHVVERGSIVASGTFDELEATSERFQSLLG